MDRAPQKDNSIIAYLNGRAIVQDEDGQIYVCAIPEEFIAIGETVFEEDLTPIAKLPLGERYVILSALAEKGVI